MGMDTLYEVVNLFSDVSFNKPLIESALYHSRKSPLYLYIYSHRGDFGVAQIYFRLTLKFPILVDGLITNVISLFNKYVLGIEEKHYGTCHADEQVTFKVKCCKRLACASYNENQIFIFILGIVFQDASTSKYY